MFPCIPLRTIAIYNLNNPELYSEPCQTSKMDFFCKNSQQPKAVNYFC